MSWVGFRHLLAETGLATCACHPSVPNVEPRLHELLFRLTLTSPNGNNRNTSSNRRVILVVEDDATLQLLWRGILRLEGFEVIEAGDGLDALRLLEQRVPDLIVLDLDLPRLDGLSVQQEVAAQAVTRHIPVVITTGSTEDLSHVNVACVLRKPVAPDDLVATVRRCLLSGVPGVGA